MSELFSRNQARFCADLVGRTVLVTGGSRGIGRAICEALAQCGAAVAVHYYQSQSAAGAIVEGIEGKGGRAIALQADISDRGAGDFLIRRTSESLGGVDILVNNAGEMTDAAIAEMSDEMWERTLAVNLTSAFRCTRACIPGMKARAWGRIINVSSQAAYNGSRDHAHYAAAKAGMLGFTFSAAKELARDGITVNAVAPGRISTDMVLDRAEGREEEWLSQTPIGRLGRPEEVADVIVFLVSESASYITGAVLNISGGQLMG